MRITNRIIGAVLGILLAVLGALVLAEAVVALLGREPLVVDRTTVLATVRELSWSSPGVLLTAIALLVAGVVLLVIQLVPRWPEELTIASTDDRLVLVDRRAVAARLADEAALDPQVRDSEARVRRHSARVRVLADPGTDTSRLRQRVTDDTGALVERLDLRKPLKTKVKISQARERTG